MLHARKHFFSRKRLLIHTLCCLWGVYVQLQKTSEGKRPQRATPQRDGPGETRRRRRCRQPGRRSRAIRRLPIEPRITCGARCLAKAAHPTFIPLAFRAAAGQCLPAVAMQEAPSAKLALKAGPAS